MYFCTVFPNLYHKPLAFLTIQRFLIRICFVLLLASFKPIRAQIVINEVVTDNFVSYKDTGNTFFPWMELYNVSNRTINLKDWMLGLNPNDYTWQFPEHVMQPGDFILVIFSGRNLQHSTEIHTRITIDEDEDFRIFLANPFAAEVDRIGPINLKTDQSFGCLPDGNKQQRIALQNPSPGASNNQTTPYISQDRTLLMSPFGGYYPSDSIVLRFFSDSPSPPIFFTLDGSEPTPQSLLYQGPFALKQEHAVTTHLSYIPTSAEPTERGMHYRFNPPQILQPNACVVRASAFVNGVRVSPIVSNTYFVGPQHKPPGVQTLATVVNQKDYFSDSTGIFVPGIHTDNNNQTVWFTTGGNYLERGPEWERPMDAALFDTRGGITWQMRVGARVHGFSSRNFSQKSFRIYARSLYQNNRLNHTFFPERNFSRYKHILFRNSGQDIVRTMFADALSCSFYKNLNIDYQLHLPVVHYLNGEYWGIINMRDRINERYIHYLYPNTDRNLIRIVGVGNENPDGGSEPYRVLRTYMEENPMNTPEALAFMDQYMDIDNFIDHQLAKIIIGAYDWPGNNVRLWWEDKPESKLRWITFDSDEAFYTPVDRNTLMHALEDQNDLWPNQAWATLPLRKMLENDSLRKQFIARAQTLIQYPFNSQNMLQHIDSFAYMYRPLIQNHINRWQLIPDSTIWERNIEVFRNFATLRPCYLKLFFTEFFSLDEADFLPDLDCRAIEEGPVSDLLIIGNPSAEYFDVNFVMTREHEVRISVYDTHGKLIHRQRENALKGQNRIPIKISQRSAPGVHYVLVHGRSFKAGAKWLRTPH